MKLLFTSLFAILILPAPLHAITSRLVSSFSLVNFTAVTVELQTNMILPTITPDYAAQYVNSEQNTIISTGANGQDADMRVHGRPHSLYKISFPSMVPISNQANSFQMQVYLTMGTGCGQMTGRTIEWDGNDQHRTCIKGTALLPRNANGEVPDGVYQSSSPVNVTVTYE